MKHIILISVILLSGCSALRCFNLRDIKELPPVTQSQAVTPRERLTNDLEQYLIWLCRAAAIAGLVALGISIKIGWLRYIASILGVIAAYSAVAIYALDYLWWVAGAAFWSLIAYFGYHLYKKSKEITRVTDLKDEAYREFENPRGELELSQKGLNEYHIQRRESKYWEKSPNNPDNKITKETENEI